MLNNIIFLGCTQDYGYQFSAANTKTELLARGLIENGNICTIHNGIVGTKRIRKNQTQENSKKINAITYREHGNQITSYFYNTPRLFKDLKKLYKKECNNTIVLELPDYHIFLLYVLLARILKYKILVISHEWGPTIPTTHPMRKPSIWVFAKTFGYFSDGILPISEYIINKIKHFKKPYLKIPIIADYSIIIPTGKKIDADYFLYCVYADYFRVISIIVDAFKEYIRIGGKSKLYFVLSGSEKQINKIKDYIDDSKCQDFILILGNLPYDELYAYFTYAKGLLIPLNPNHDHDKARFSQKIAEYLSSGSPIITNDVGEIKYYFQDKVNAIVLPDYSLKTFCETFIWMDNHPEILKEIGKKGKELGSIAFNYNNHANALHNFILKIHH